MSSLPKQMGEYDSTTNVGNDGLRIFNAQHNKNSEPFVEDTTEDYVEEDNIKVILTDYSNWLVTTYIPKYFDEDLKSNRTIKLSTGTLKNYLSKVILMLKDKFPNPYDWEELDWTKIMSGEEFDKKCKREKGKGILEVSEETKRRLYSKASQWPNSNDDHWMSNIDLEQVNINPMKTAEHGYTYPTLQKRAMINFSK